MPIKKGTKMISALLIKFFIVSVFFSTIAAGGMQWEKQDNFDRCMTELKDFEKCKNITELGDE